MSQHITGNVGQNVRQDLGDFISICGHRVRKDLVTIYDSAKFSEEQRDEEDKSKDYGVRVHICSIWFGIPVGTKEEAEKEVERLDWIYKKQE